MGKQQSFSLFKNQVVQPLAEILRPNNLSDVIGQEHLLGETTAIGKMILSGRLLSCILWGPTGCGKTTLARLLSKQTDMHFESVSAVFSGVVELRKIFKQAEDRQSSGQGTLLFVDEIHRFSRAQQDAFLPVVEDGRIILIGATTENPSFQLNDALLSRCQILILKRLSDKDLEKLLLRAEQQIGDKIPLSQKARSLLINMADGDGRFLLNLVEQLASLKLKAVLDENALTKTLNRRAVIYDKGQEGHYNLISALHKSLRGSDVNAALYWLARMLVGGEDPAFISRRLVRFASEDIGLAEPSAVTHAISAWEAYERLGPPEGELAIAGAVVFLATAPKSNALYMAMNAAKKQASINGSLSPPKHILNAPTNLMKEVGYSEGYIYDHDTLDGFSGQNYFPDDMERQIFYQPVGRGFESEIKKRLDHWEHLRTNKNDRDT